MSLVSQLRAELLTQGLPPPSLALLTQLTTARTPPPPLPSLLATARARILACDLSSASTSTTSSSLRQQPHPVLDTSALPTLPPAAGDAASRESRLPADVFVQVLDVENLSASRWEQVEELEAVERGERTRGREVIRVSAEDDDEANQPHTQTQQTRAPAAGAGGTGGGAGAGKTATHRVTLQDHAGKQVYGLELSRLERLGVGTTLVGEKWLLRRGAAVSRGVVMLTPETCVVLGGKVDAWHRAWVEGRLARLKEAVGGAASGGGGGDRPRPAS
ncbi:hypothetical protein N3K66_003869 [Trichothecium roseum]|uniref:Uncharacterized protein n=1 Tax=Trichothecium roseum TaxID=47278 RepID=A0ACC0V7D9_9HYPO|nr:hypothetical protein N3K66_003869 [Trichothecium roseum]